MRSRISWLVLATTSAVVMAFVIPLCLLVRTLAADRAMSAADQAARNVALVLAGTTSRTQLEAYLDDLNRSIVPQVAVLTPGGRTLGAAQDLSRNPEVLRALDGESVRVDTGEGGAVLLPVAGERGTAVVRATVTEADLGRGVTAAWTAIVLLGLVLLALGVAHRPPAGTADQRATARGGPDRPPAPRGRPDRPCRRPRHARDRRARPGAERSGRAHRRAARGRAGHRR